MIRYVSDLILASTAVCLLGMSRIHSHPGCFASRPAHGNRMNRLLSTASLFCLFIFSFANSASTFAQAPPPSHPYAGLKEKLNTLVATPGISGYETELTEKIRVEISTFHPTFHSK